MTLKQGTTFSFLIALIIFAVSCSPRVGDSGSDKGKLVINLEGGDWGYPSPYTHYSRGPGVFKMRLLFDSLLERGEKGLIPWLAEKWSVSPDGRSYSFTIRKGVKWHDGESLTADDLKFSFEYFILHPPASDELSAYGRNFIKGCKVIDPHSIRITVNSPDATLLAKLGSTRIIPRHVWENVKDPKKFDSPQSVIGSGPFVLTGYSREEGSYRFEAFKDYNGPKQAVDVIRFIPVSDSVLAFEKGEIDLTSVPADLVKRYENDPGYTIIRNPAFWGYRLLFNIKKKPELKDKKLRHAFAFSINRKELVEKVARGAAVEGSMGYLPVDHVWYNSRVKTYPFEPAKGKELLSGRKYSFTLLTGNSRDEVRIAELLKISLSIAGFNINVKSIDMKSRDAAVRSGDYEIALNGHGGWGSDPDMLRRVYSGTVRTDASPSSDAIPGYSNSEINRLAMMQLREMNSKKRKEIIFRMQEIIAEEVPQVPLYNTKGYTVFRNKKYSGWRHMFDHHEVTHNKLSYIKI